MNTREIDPWYIIFYDSLPVDEDRISRTRPYFFDYSYHNAFNHLRYLLHSYTKSGNFRHRYKPPFSIAQEIERFHADTLSVIGIDIYEKSPTAIRFLMGFLPGWFGASYTTHHTTVTFKSQLDTWLKEHKDEINPNFLDNLEKAIVGEMSLAEKDRTEIFNQLDTIENTINKNKKELPLQDQISFLNRECENLMKHYEIIIQKMLKKNKKVFEECKQDSTTLKSTDEIVDDIAKNNPLVKSYIKKNAKNLAEVIEKYKLVREQYKTLQGPESRQDKLQMFSKQFKKSEKIIAKHRDPMLIRFAKICLFTLAAILSLGQILRAYNTFFQPHGKAYTNKVRRLGLIEPDKVENTKIKKSRP
jgi:hypothetical protein